MEAFADVDLKKPASASVDIVKSYISNNPVPNIRASNAEQIGDTSNNFQSSSNFRHMKKYFQYKYEHENREVDAVLVQPPLPPNSPPPYPPDFVVKQEVVGNAYENNTQPSMAPNPQDAKETPRKIMCKDFVRGTCKRESCFFNHEIDLTQLKGIYKFCRDFANGKCQRPKCKFVHATTFEKENFYRTGVIPPETMSHIEDPALAPMPTIPEEQFPVFPFGERKSDHHFGYAPQFSPTITNPPLPPAVAPAAQFTPTMRYPLQPSAVAPAAQFPPTMRYPLQPPAVAPAAQFPPTIRYPPLPPAVVPPAAVSYRPLPPPPVAPPNNGMFFFAAPQSAAAPMPEPMHVSHEARPAMARTHTYKEKAPCINCTLSKIRYKQTLAKIESVEKFTRQINENIAKLEAKKVQLISAITKVLTHDGVFSTDSGAQ